MVGKVVTKTRVTVRARIMMYKSVMKLVLIYGSKNLVVTGAMLKLLEGFHHRVAISITGMKERRTRSGEWEWPPVSEALRNIYIRGRPP